MAGPDRGAGHDASAGHAIIDIGSNTVRLVVYGGPPRAPVVLHNEKVTARLGRAVAESGRLGDKASRLALAALARYRMLLDLKGVRQVDVVATAAVRDASNGAAFLEQVAALGFAPRLLSGEEEAVTSALGVIGAFPGAAGVVADLGGGSLELVDIANGASSHGVSLPLGTLRLPALRAGGIRGFREHVAERLGAAGWSAPHGAALYLVGGSFRSLARHALHLAHSVLDDPHGFALPAQAAAAQARSLARRKPESLVAVPGLSATRLAALPDAAALLLALIDQLRPAEVVFSSWGLREGLLYAALPEGTRRQDPLLAGVSAFIKREGTSPTAAAMVAGWTAPVSGLAATAPAPQGPPPAGAAAGPVPAGGSERLRLAAIMLALASARAEPNLRGDLATMWALRKRWIGIGNRERAMLAAAVLASTGRLDIVPAWQALAATADLRLAQAWGLAVRLCRRFSDASAQSLSGSTLLLSEGVLTLTVGRAYAVLVNEGVERDLKALGGVLGARTARRVAAD